MTYFATFIPIFLQPYLESKFMSKVTMHVVSNAANVIIKKTIKAFLDL